MAKIGKGFIEANKKKTGQRGWYGRPA